MKKLSFIIISIMITYYTLAMGNVYASDPDILNRTSRKYNLDTAKLKDMNS